jgi:hypothetical protein
MAIPAHAQVATSSEVLSIEVASSSPETTNSAELATASASVQPAPQRPESDFTETNQTQDTLLQFLQKQPPITLQWYNPIRYGVFRAVENGIPANIMVLILLFPVITAIISASRHVVGLKGFGIYTPAVLSVAFLSTGILNGILLFLITIAASAVMKKILRRLKLQYLPRTAMLLWGVSIFMIIVLIGVSFLPFSDLFTIRIFPLLIIMLLTENFLESQVTGSSSEAQQLTIETLILAILCSVVIGLEPVQQFVLLQPELTLFSVAALNMIVGRYTGLRLLEWLRFRDIISK